MLTIPLANTHHVAIISEEKAHLILPLSWHLNAQRAPTLYAQHSSGRKMHQFIIPDVPPGFVRHHKDGNGLNNQDDNLTVIPATENAKHKRKYNNNTSGHPGVYLDKRYGLWRAYVDIDGVRTWLGKFKTVEDAIAARQTNITKYAKIS